MTAHSTLIGAFDNHARHRPDDLAVVSEHGSVTYGQLRQRSLELAAGMGVACTGPGRVLAVTVDEGHGAITALLAAVRAAAPVVWLDRDLPPERRAAILADCRPAAMLYGGDDGFTPLVVEPVRPEPEPAGVPDDTCCVVYTSGSTGVPKGIVQRLPNLEHLAGWIAGEVGLRPGTRVLQWARMSYDAAYAEIFAAIFAGATLVVPPAKAKGDVVAVARWLADHKVTHIQSVPTLCRALLAARDQAGAAPLPDVRVLSLFGEQLTHELVAEVRRHLPAAEIYNLYGPTECTLATYFRVTHTAPGLPVPIGQAIPGREISLRDESGAEVPEEAFGEVWIRSARLAYGYLNQPEATAGAFLPDDRGEPGLRLYRTGDLARRLPNGHLIFEGRIDDQVKVRGARVELGEIEAALRRNDEVADAATVTRSNDTSDARLVAYLAPRHGQVLDIQALHRRLVSALPTYMVPAEYVALDVLPRTATGKIDRLRLPEPGSGRERDSYAPPATATEAWLAELWGELLGVGRVGRTDDFFALGGESLLAPRVVAAVADRFDVELPMLALFENPMLHGLAGRIDDLSLPAMPARPAEPEDGPPC